MEINQIQWDEENECPISNLPIYERFRGLDNYFMTNGHFSLPYMKLRNKKYKSTKACWADAFGKQMCCKDYGIRNWIWSISNKDNTACLYLIYSSKGGDVSVNTKYDLDKSVDLYKEVMDYLTEKCKK